MARASRQRVTEVGALRERIRAAGLRVTAPRVAVLDHLERATSPVSHPELSEALAPDGWDRATIYRNLIDLTDAGLLRRTDLGDHVWRFEVKGEAGDARGNEHHPHFVCDACGDVTCLPEEIIEVHATRGAPRSLRGGDVEIQVKGRCDNCE